MIKVLITGAGAVLGQGIFRALRRSTIAAQVTTADPSPLSAGLYWSDRARLVPWASDPHYIDRMSDLLAKERPDVVLVGTDVELLPLARARAMLEATHSTKILVSDPHVVAIAEDKYETFKFLRDAGFAPPLSALPEDRAELELLIAQSGFPLVVKPRVGARSVGVGTVTTRADLEAALNGRTGLVVQECVGTPDLEFTSSAVVFDGSVDASIVMRRDLRDGNTYRAYCEPYEDLNAQVREMAAALQPFGPANFQFRTDSRGRARVFEINGRFSGATPLRALVGFNEVEMCIRKLLFGEVIRQPDVETAVILRHWSETLVQPSRIKAIE